MKFHSFAICFQRGLPLKPQLRLYSAWWKAVALVACPAKPEQAGDLSGGTQNCLFPWQDLLPSL